MRVWRLTKASYTPLDGEGARLYGGRWNSIGKAVVYTASSLSLTILEQLVRLNLDEIPDDFVRMEIELPDTLALTNIEFTDFPQDWRHNNPIWFRQQGDAWLAKQEFVALCVPSVIVPEERNVLINPLHIDAQQIKIINIQPFVFDTRLF